MRQTVRFGRIAGIPIGAHWSVGMTLLIVAYLLGDGVLPSAAPREPTWLYWLIGAGGAVVFLASLLAHELAHALIARRDRMRVRSVTLWMLGGVTQLDDEPPTAGADLGVALAGPVMSGLVAAAFLGAGYAARYAGGPRIAAAALLWLGLMNGILAVFNLLPGSPLDGGRVLRGLLWRHWRDRRRAEHGAAVAGRVLGALVTGLGIVELIFYDLLGGVWLAMIGWFMASSATAEEKAYTAMAALTGVRVADLMTPEPEPLPSWATVAHAAVLARSQPARAAFAITDAGGRLAGVVTTRELARIRPDDRPGVRLAELAVSVPAEYLAAPGDPAAPLLRRVPLGGEVAAVVLAGGHVVGLVTADDLRRTIRWRDPARATLSGRA